MRLPPGPTAVGQSHEAFQLQGFVLKLNLGVSPNTSIGVFELAQMF